MSLKVRNNAGVMSALSNVRNNDNRVGKILQSVATGQKIVGAGDAASDYSISEKMRAQLRSLNQQIQNVQNGASLLKVAAGGVDSITDELRCLKELAIDSANDSNTDKDRLTLQKVFSQRVDNIDDIATSTNYNGRKLLDGGLRAYIEGDGVTQVTKIVSENQSKTLTEANSSFTHITNVLSDVETDLGEDSKLISKTDPPTKSASTTSTVWMSADEYAESIGADGTFMGASTSSGPIEISRSLPVKSTLDEDIKTDKTTDTESEISSMTSIRETKTLEDGTVEESSTREYTVTETSTSFTKVSSSIGTETIETWQTKTTETTPVTVISSVANNTYKYDEVTPTVIDRSTITGATYTIDKGGAYDVSGLRGFTLNITTDEEIALVGNGGTLTDFHVNVSNTSANLYIKDLKISNTTNASTFAFGSGSDNKLHLIGTGNSIVNTNHGTAADINVGGGLTICGTGSLSINITPVGTRTDASGAVIGSDANGSCGAITVDNGVNLSVISNASSSSKFMHGALIGSGSGGKCGDRTINGNSSGDHATVTVEEKYLNYNQGALIGSGRAAQVSNITIMSHASVTATRPNNDSNGTHIGLGDSGTGNTTITVYSGAILNLIGGAIRSAVNYRIGGGTNASNSVAVSVYSGVTGTNQYSIGGKNLSSDRQYGNKVSSYLEKTTTTGSDTSLGPLVKYIPGYDVTTEEYTLTTESIYEHTHTKRNYDVTENIYTAIDTKTYNVYESATTLTSTVTNYAPEHALAIHSGSKAGQNIRMHIEDMHTDALGINDASVRTREAATSAIAVIDNAINYALDQATSLGAIIKRLEYTESNLVTAGENTQASESVIRDADMAKAMMDYTRSNVLQQAAQTLLAQANQNTESVLNLLR